MANPVAYETPPRRYQRVSLPKGMFVAWYGGGDHQTSRVQTPGMGGVLIVPSNPPAVGDEIRLVFEVPGGTVRADGIVRSVLPGKGMGIEFTKLGPQDRILLDKLLKRLLQ